MPRVEFSSFAFPKNRAPSFLRSPSGTNISRASLHTAIWNIHVDGEENCTEWKQRLITEGISQFHCWFFSAYCSQARKNYFVIKWSNIERGQPRWSLRSRFPSRQVIRILSKCTRLRDDFLWVWFLNMFHPVTVQGDWWSHVSSQCRRIIWIGIEKWNIWQDDWPKINMSSFEKAMDHIRRAFWGQKVFVYGVVSLLSCSPNNEYSVTNKHIHKYGKILVISEIYYCCTKTNWQQMEMQ